MTSLRKYESILNNQYDIIYWKRHNFNETCNAQNVFTFDYPFPEGLSIKEKLVGYIKFRRFIKAILKKNKYEKIIVLPTQTAIILADVLLFQFKEKYVLDIRDYTAENKKLFGVLMRSLVKNAGVVSLTSPAFKSFLPNRNYIISHNYIPIEKEVISGYREKRHNASDPIEIMCIGGIRFIDYFEKVIQIFANDSRFNLSFIGLGAEHLEDYVRENDVNNVTLSGMFQSDETLSLFLKADIANNLFGHGMPLLDFALSNRLYYAIQLGMPTLACVGTYTEQIVRKHNIGFSFDENDEHIKDKLFDYYSNIEWTSFYRSCDSFFDMIQQDEQNFNNTIAAFLLNNNN